MPTTYLTRDYLVALSSFILDAQARGLRPKTMVFYEGNVTAFLRYAMASGCTQLADIDPNTLRAYLALLQGEKGLAPASVHAHARAVRAFLNFCVTEGLLAASPMARVRMPANEQPQKEPFSAAELRRLVAACKSQRDRAIVACLLDSGCRMGEFLSWRIGDVDLRSGAVHLRAGNTKGRRDRTVYLGAMSRRELVRLFTKELSDLGAEELIWRTAAGPLKPTGLRELLKRLGKRAEVDPCNAHRFRHTFAIEFLRAGGDIFSLQGLLGHKDLSMVRRYLALTAQDLQSAHAQAGPGDRLLR